MNLPKGRTVAYAVTVLFCAVGVFFLITSLRYRRDSYRWQTARPVDMAVDLSKPGQFVGTFKQTCHISHGEALCLMLQSNMVLTSTWTNMLGDLRFIAEIKDQNGDEKLREEFGGALFWGDYLLDGAIPLLHFAPFENGDYQTTITVKNGVPALNGTTQRIVARYMLCGLEMLPAFVSMVFGIAAFVIAGVLALVTALIVRRRRKISMVQTPTP